MYKVKKHIGIRIFFLALFLSYFADITFFTHSHIINGSTIVHSHYFPGYSSTKDNKPAKHTHTENALTLISQASNWNATMQELPEIPGIELTRIIDYSQERITAFPQPVPSLFYLRGPPAMA